MNSMNLPKDANPNDLHPRSPAVLGLAAGVGILAGSLVSSCFMTPEDAESSDLPTYKS